MWYIRTQFMSFLGKRIQLRFQFCTAEHARWCSRTRAPEHLCLQDSRTYWLVTSVLIFANEQLLTYARMMVS